MSDASNSEETHEDEPEFDLAEFLESHPPNQMVRISNLAASDTRPGLGRVSEFAAPQIQLHCPNENCNGERFFRCVDNNEQRLPTNGYAFFFVKYRCYNCLTEEKTYSLAAKVDSAGAQLGECFKFGELPAFGPPTPARLIKLIGPDRDEFLKGRRCENQGLGVGAFIYYRRVVEGQKNRILREIVQVSERIEADQGKIDALNSAISETQFSAAFEIAKESIPESLLVNGHNPLLLLHRALSEGVHELSDEECLQIASSVRVVLGELSERISQALKDEDELKKALGTLMSRPQRR